MSALRCRKGDMAIVLFGPYSGYMVTVVEFMGSVSAEGWSGEAYLAHDVWAIESDSVPQVKGGLPNAAEDRHLLPIRPGDLDETDETSKELEVAK